MPNLPCEILDHIVDLLHDGETALRNCCLVSKSWVTRTRKQLFAEVHFQTAKSLESWKTTFPDPSTSPARYTKALFIRSPKVVKAVDVEAGSWIKGFSRVVHLAMVGPSRFSYGWELAFVQFRGFSPFVKSLRVHHLSYPPPHLFDLVISFPLLTDLSVFNCYPSYVGRGPPTPTQPPSLPAFAGSLHIHLRGGMEPVVNRWLSLPGGIHFRKLTLAWFREEDVPLTTMLVERCSHTLESLDISDGYARGMSIGHPMYPRGGNMCTSL